MTKPNKKVKKIVKNDQGEDIVKMVKPGFWKSTASITALICLGAFAAVGIYSLIGEEANEYAKYFISAVTVTFIAKAIVD